MTDPVMILGVGILIGLALGFVLAWSFVYRMVEKALDKGVPVRVKMDPEQRAEWERIRTEWERTRDALWGLERTMTEDDTVIDLKLDVLDFNAMRLPR